MVITSNHVVAEILTLTRSRGKQDTKLRHARAVDLGRKLYAGAFGRIHQASAEEERAAFEFVPGMRTRSTASPIA